MPRPIDEVIKDTTEPHDRWAEEHDRFDADREEETRARRYSSWNGKPKTSPSPGQTRPT